MLYAISKRERAKALYQRALSALGLNILSCNPQSAEVPTERVPIPTYICIKYRQFILYIYTYTLFILCSFQGSNVNYGKSERQNSPLHLAAINGHIEVCRLLLKSGARRYVINHIDRTAAQTAADNGMYTNCIKVGLYG